MIKIETRMMIVYNTYAINFTEIPGFITFINDGDTNRTYLNLNDVAFMAHWVGMDNTPEYDGPWNEDEVEQDEDDHGYAAAMNDESTDYSMEGWDHDEMDGANDQDYDSDYQEKVAGLTDDDLDAVEAELEYYRMLDDNSITVYTPENGNLVISRYSDNPIMGAEDRQLYYNEKRAEINEIVKSLMDAGDINGAYEVRRGFDAQYDDTSDNPAFDQYFDTQDEGPRVIGKIDLSKWADVPFAPVHLGKVDLDSTKFSKPLHNHVLNCKPVGHLYNPASETVATTVDLEVMDAVNGNGKAILYNPMKEHDDDFGKESFVIPQVSDDEFYANDL